jgi:uncharacterized damage-inducible protein DinB
MTNPTFPRLEITPYWASITDQLVEIVEALSEEQLNQRPSPGAWPVRGYLIHIIGGRPGPMDAQMRPLEPAGDIFTLCATKDGLKQQLRDSWARLERFLSDPAQLERIYTPPPPDPEAFRNIAEGPPLYPAEPVPDSGYFIAYHPLVHDVHHRADILNCLAQLGIKLEGVRRLHPL